MMDAVRISEAAQLDLEQIAFFIAEDNPVRAQEFVNRLVARCLDLQHQPLLGRAREEFGEDIRGIPYERYLILYRRQDSQIFVERIVHGARDLNSIQIC